MAGLMFPKGRPAALEREDRRKARKSKEPRRQLDLWRPKLPGRTRPYGRFETRKTKACAICSAAFVARLIYRTRTWSRFCSDKCRRAWLSRRPAMLTASCTQCGATFKRTAAAIKRVRRVFCGRVCRAAHMTGENSPMFRGDKDPNRGAAWNRLAESIRERDKYTCRRCEAKQGREKLSVDHVRPWRSFEDKELANHPDNLVALCRTCHSFKTTTVEQQWLRGDRIAWLQWVKSLHLESAAYGWVAAAKGVHVEPRPVVSNGLAERTHCKRGHEFTPENTFINKRGASNCRTCVRMLASAFRRTDRYREKHAAYERARRQRRLT